MFQVLRPHHRCDNLLADYCDGELYKSHELFGSHETALQIIMYFDEVETCNPLGGHNGERKLGKVLISRHVSIIIICTGVFYYTVGNLPPQLRSTQRAIQLVACVTAPHIKEYGLQPILKPIIDDVNILAKVLCNLWF